MIFISYRRGDSAIFTGRLYDRLVAAFGAQMVFMDIHSIHVGDFTKIINEHLQKSRVLLAVIGDKWHDKLRAAEQVAGQPDYLRIEIEQAIAMGRCVIPVYCDETKCLTADQLPESLKPLALANAFSVKAGPEFDAQIARLIREIDRTLSPGLIGRATHKLRRFARRHIAAAWLVSLLLISLLVFKTVRPVRDWGTSRLLAFSDPTLFQGSPTGEYRMTRMFPGSHAVREQATFALDAGQTRTEFCMFANTFGFFRDHVTTFEELARRGVKLRFVTSAFHEEDRVHWETFEKLTREPSPVEALAQAKAIRCLILDLKAKFPNEVELRLNRRPMFYTMWLRDPAEPTGIGHVGLHYYAEKSRWPSFRVSQNTGREMLPLMAEQFEEVWAASEVAKADECSK